jgi:hypothetical protein
MLYDPIKQLLKISPGPPPRSRSDTAPAEGHKVRGVRAVLRYSSTSTEKLGGGGGGRGGGILLFPHTTRRLVSSASPVKTASGARGRKRGGWSSSGLAHPEDKVWVAGSPRASGGPLASSIPHSWLCSEIPAGRGSWGWERWPEAGRAAEEGGRGSLDGGPSVWRWES